MSTKENITSYYDTLKAKKREFIVECIQLYRKLPALWNVKSKEYYDRSKKKAAYEKLLCKYREMFPKASREDVKKRFNSLRTNYRKELKKHLDSIKSGASADEIYQPTLYYFHEFLCFLKDYEPTSSSQSSMDTHTNNVEDTQNVYYIQSPGDESNNSSMDDNCTQKGISTIETEEEPSTSCAVPKTKNNNLKRKFEYDLMQLAADRLTKKQDEYQNWALSCAADLKKMEPLQQIFAKKAIADIIMEGQLGLLHRDSVKINSPTTKSP